MDKQIGLTDLDDSLDRAIEQATRLRASHARLLAALEGVLSAWDGPQSEVWGSAYAMARAATDARAAIAAAKGM